MEEILWLSFTGLLGPQTQWTHLHYDNRQKLFFFSRTETLLCWFYWLRSSYSSSSAFSEGTINFQIFTCHCFLRFPFPCIKHFCSKFLPGFMAFYCLKGPSSKAPFSLCSSHSSCPQCGHFWRLSALPSSGFRSGLQSWLHSGISQRALLKCLSPDPSLGQ